MPNRGSQEPLPAADPYPPQSSPALQQPVLGEKFLEHLRALAVLPAAQVISGVW